MYRGHGLKNEAHAVCYEYFTRKEMANLGFTSSFDELEWDKAQDFMLISAEIAKINNEDSKRKKKK